MVGGKHRQLNHAVRSFDLRSLQDWLGSVMGPSKTCTGGGGGPEDLNGGLLAQQHLDDLATITLLSKQVEMVQLSRRVSAGPEPEPRPAPDLGSPAGGGQTSCARGHLFFGKCMCDAGYRGIRCDDLYKPVLPCVDNPRNKNEISLSPELGTDRCFQNEVYGRMVPPDGADRWKKAQKFETGLWATTGNSDDRVQTHIDGYSGFAVLNGQGFNPVFGTLLEVGSGPFTQTKGMLASVPGAVVSNLTFFVSGRAPRAALHDPAMRLPGSLFPARRPSRLYSAGIGS